MISLNALTVVEAQAVDLGHLVLCSRGNEWEFAIRVEAPGGQVGLLMLRAEIPYVGRRPVVFGECADARCVDLAVPEFVCAHDGPTMKTRTTDYGASVLSIRSCGLTIVATVGQPGSTGLWNVVTGKRVQSVEAGIAISNWAVGVRDVNGKFKPLLRFPDDFTGTGG